MLLLLHCASPLKLGVEARRDRPFCLKEFVNQDHRYVLHAVSLDFNQSFRLDVEQSQQMIASQISENGVVDSTAYSLSSAKSVEFCFVPFSAQRIRIYVDLQLSEEHQSAVHHPTRVKQVEDRLVRVLDFLQNVREFRNRTVESAVQLKQTSVQLQGGWRLAGLVLIALALALKLYEARAMRGVLLQKKVI